MSSHPLVGVDPDNRGERAAGETGSRMQFKSIVQIGAWCNYTGPSLRLCARSQPTPGSLQFLGVYIFATVSSLLCDGNCQGGSRGRPRGVPGTRDWRGPCDPISGNLSLQSLLAVTIPPSTSDTDRANAAVIFRSPDESFSVRFSPGSPPIRLPEQSTVLISSQLAHIHLLCALHQSALLSTSPFPSLSLPFSPFNVVRFVFSSSLSRRRRRQRSRGRSRRVWFMEW